MAKEDWYKKLRSSLPSWFFEKEGVQIAYLMGAAKLLDTIESAVSSHVKETRIGEAGTEFLDAHGKERGISRLGIERNSEYRKRLRQIGNIANVPDLLSLVESLLISGKAYIQEKNEGAVFFNRKFFLNRGALILEPIENNFNVLVDPQKKPPEFFFNRGDYLSRSSFMKAKESSRYVLEILVEAINREKSAGTTYRLIERL